MVNPALKGNEAERMHVSVSDPARPGTEAATSPKDWTIHRPETVKIKDPPPKPISQVLMDHLKTMWTASANAVQIEQVQDQLTPPNPAAINHVSASLAKQSLIYQPSKVNKTEDI